ncbi:hypothetical protein PVAND_003099 [Polypedilum vanderplanki]|uniref:Peptidase S1 domain-containing protein n=1 Tax=Polypedilum vanderplanki TaxID=319348 RepID=A0A9J6BTX6_POLVA|nr:hypothetical protein PVAND_003099 [Polypedilum vanderplanki]
MFKKTQQKLVQKYDLIINVEQKIELTRWKKCEKNILIAILLVLAGLCGFLIFFLVQQKLTKNSAVKPVNVKERFLRQNEIDCQNSLSLLDKLQSDELSKYPYIARLITYNKTKKEKEEEIIKCGGILVANNLIITAAHCLGDDILSIHIGGSQSKNFNDVIKIKDFAMISHHSFNETKSEENDIGLIKLKRPIGNVRTACLPQTKVDTVEKLTFLGFNDTSFYKAPEILKFYFNFVNSSDCNEQYKNYYDVFIPSKEFVEMSNDQICAKSDEEGIDSKRGDSGLPLFSGNHVYAIVKGGIGEDFFPGIYTKVDPFIDWIASNALNEK